MQERKPTAGPNGITQWGGKLAHRHATRQAGEEGAKGPDGSKEIDANLQTSPPLSLDALHEPAQIGRRRRVR